MDLFVGHFHMKDLHPLGRFGHNIIQKVCGFQINLLSKLIHLKIMPHCGRPFPSSPTRGVRIPGGYSGLVVTGV